MFQPKVDIYDKRAAEFENFKKLLEDVIKKVWYEGLHENNLDAWPVFEKLLKLFDTLERIKENGYFIENLDSKHALLLWDLAPSILDLYENIREKVAFLSLINTDSFKQKCSVYTTKEAVEKDIKGMVLSHGISFESSSNA